MEGLGMSQMPCGMRDPQTYAIIGAAMEVHKELGHGFLEVVYQEALAREFTRRGIPYRREVELPIFYKGERLACYYKVDFICFEDVIVQTKSMKQLGPVERAQVLNYLKASRMARALLINFGCASLEYERVVGPVYREPVAVEE
jgi:GxxExxY protein